jgi:methionyl aminopeptidase
MHEDPQIYNWGEQGTGNKLVENMVICVEPMLMTGGDKWYVNNKDNWTVIAKNHKLTCHCEYMILVTKDGYKNLTK